MFATVRGIKETLGAIRYWLQPTNWWAGLGVLVRSSNVEIWVLILTMLAIILWMLGAEKAPKYGYWLNIIYWGLRFFIFG